MKKAILIIILIAAILTNAQQFTVRDKTLQEIAEFETDRNVNDCYYIMSGSLSALSQSALFILSLTQGGTIGCYLQPLFYLSFIPLAIFIKRGIAKANKSIYSMEKYGDDVKNAYDEYLTFTTSERIITNFVGSYLTTICATLLTVSIVWYTQ